MVHDPENTLILDLKSGPVTIALRPDLAPNHVARVKELTRQGFYDGVVFHRVIPGFMAQSGDPTGTGSGGSDLPDLKAEFSNEKHVRGTVSAARTANPNSANSQFYICFDDAPWLDKQYSVWGQAWSMSTPSRRAASTTMARSAASRIKSSRRILRRTIEGVLFGNIW